MNPFAYTFAILFLTLGPLKTIPAFHLLTLEAEARYRRQVAFRAFVVASAIVTFIALVAGGKLVRWRVPIEALTIAGGIILFVSALKNVVGFELIEPPSARASDEPPAPLPAPRWTGKPVLNPLAIPTIVTPTAVVAIVFFLTRSAGDPSFRLEVILAMGLMMVLNLIGMLIAGPVMRLIGLAILSVIGWVFSVLQAGFAVQMVLGSLRSLRIIS